jgi:hypothetical protein
MPALVNRSRCLSQSPAFHSAVISRTLEANSNRSTSCILFYTLKRIGLKKTNSTIFFRSPLPPRTPQLFTLWSLTVSCQSIYLAVKIRESVFSFTIIVHIPVYFPFWYKLNLVWWLRHWGLPPPSTFPLPIISHTNMSDAKCWSEGTTTDTKIRSVIDLQRICSFC